MSSSPPGTLSFGPKACPTCGFSNPRSFTTCVKCVTALDDGGVPVLPLMGRAATAESVNSQIDKAFSLGVPTLSAIEGDRGSGTSRLLLHAAEYAARVNPETLVLFGGCGKAASHDVYAPFSGILREYFRIDPMAPTVATGARILSRVSEVLSTKDAVTVAEHTHLLGHLAGIPFPNSPFLAPLEGKTEQLRDNLGRALRTLIEAEAQKRPVTLLLDDAHQMQPAAFSLLRELCRTDGHLAICVAGQAPLLKLTSELSVPGETAAIMVPDMGSEDVASMLYVLIPTLESAPEPLVSALTHRSGGKPANVQALVHALRDQEVFIETDDGTSVDLSKLESGSLAISMDDATKSRLSRLSDLEKLTLERAATMGERFWDGGILAQVRSELQTNPTEPVDPLTLWRTNADAALLDSSLQGLIQRGFIVPTNTHLLPGATEYSFAIPGLRDALYASVDENIKVARHVTVAKWMAVVAEIQREGMAALIAPHLEEAGWLHRAGRAFFEAAAYERARMRIRTALAYIERALPLIPEEDVVRLIDALHEQGSLLASLGSYDEALDSFSKMLEHAWKVGALRKGAAALSRIGRVHRERGEEVRAKKVFTQALEVFRKAGDLRGVASTLDDLAQVVRLIDDPAAALKLANEALEIRRNNGDRRGEAVSLNTVGSIELSRGRLDEAEPYFSTALKIRRDLGDNLGMIRCENALGVIAFQRGDVGSALSAWTEALARAQEMGTRREQCFLLNNLGEAYIVQGNHNEAELTLEQAYTLATMSNDRRTLSEVVRNRGLLALAKGENNSAKLFEEALALAKEYGGREAMGHAHRAIGHAKGNAGDVKGAESDLRESISQFRAIQNEREAARSLAMLGHLLAETDRTETAIEILTEAQGIFERNGAPDLDRVKATLLALRS